MAQKSYRSLCLAIDPGCTLHSIKLPTMRVFSVKDSKGKEIGYSDGNEHGSTWAWLRAYAHLKQRKEKANGQAHHP